jgi:hypothetical protein
MQRGITFHHSGSTLAASAQCVLVRFSMSHAPTAAVCRVAPCCAALCCAVLCCAQVTDIRLITDRHTKKSKGLAYVEFSKQEEVFAALTLTGQVGRACFLGFIQVLGVQGLHVQGLGVRDSVSRAWVSRAWVSRAWVSRTLGMCGADLTLARHVHLRGASQFCARGLSGCLRTGDARVLLMCTLDAQTAPPPRATCWCCAPAAHAGPASDGEASRGREEPGLGGSTGSQGVSTSRCRPDCPGARVCSPASTHSSTSGTTGPTWPPASAGVWVQAGMCLRQLSNQPLNIERLSEGRCSCRLRTSSAGWAHEGRMVLPAPSAALFALLCM